MKIYILLFFIIIFFDCYTISKNVSYENNSLKDIAKDNSNMANKLIQEYNYKKALEYLKDSLKYNIMADNFEGIIKNYLDIGKVNILLQDSSEGLRYYYRALNTFKNEENNSKYRYLEAYIYNSIGEAYYLLKDYSKAIDFFNMALNIEKSLNNKENIAIIYQNMAKIEKSNNNLKKSLEYLLLALSILEKLYNEKEIKNIYNLSNIYYLIGLIYSKLDHLNEAKRYLFKALEIDRMTENSRGIGDDYYGIAIISEKEKNFEKSLLYFIKAKDIYRLIDDLEQYKDVTKKIINIQYYLGLYKEYINSIQEMILLSKGDEKKYYLDMLVNSLKDENIKKELTNEEINEILKKFNIYSK